MMTVRCCDKCGQDYMFDPILDMRFSSLCQDCAHKVEVVDVTVKYPGDVFMAKMQFGAAVFCFLSAILLIIGIPMGMYCLPSLEYAVVLGLIVSSMFVLSIMVIAPLLVRYQEYRQNKKSRNA